MNKITKLFRKATIFGIAMTSTFAPPMPQIKTKGDKEDEESSVVQEDGIISSEFLMRGEWQGWSAMDDHLYGYESLENLVSHDNIVEGNYWKQVTLVCDEPCVYTLKGVRNDDREFTTHKKEEVWRRSAFDQLCQDFNKNLTVERV